MAMGTRQREQRVRGDFVQVYQNFGNSLAERGRIELPETLSVFDCGIRPEVGPLAQLLDPKKSMGVGENLFASDSALLRLSPFHSFATLMRGVW
jgi:hypothetical protein